ncbi:hypothetical protein B0H14DRAFT_2620162 [Mycena olivaceomarginata]|nr:hypothetical protein B0H14DRAFT_2620162 [Mycena olivaceomarginata]
MAHPNFLLTSRTFIVGGSSGIDFAVTSGALWIQTPVSLSRRTCQRQRRRSLSNTKTLEIHLLSVLDAAVKETGGALDHIVYTAGDSEIWNIREEVGGNNCGVGAQALHPNPEKYLNPAASSSITLTSGLLAYRPRPGSSPMIGPAGAVEVLTRALAVDLAPIRVNVVIPGQVDTEFFQGLFGGNTEILSKIKAANLTKQIGTPEGAAEAYLFCMRSALATGQGFKIDNGNLMVRR